MRVAHHKRGAEEKPRNQMVDLVGNLLVGMESMTLTVAAGL
jgi:hypothetical protein